LSQKDRLRWDRKWRERRAGEQPSGWLLRHQELLTGGIATDMACGRGGDALWLAGRGYAVLGVDGSMEALRQARRRALAARVQNILFVQADLDNWRLPVQAVDLLTVFRFLDRRLFTMFWNAVRPGGLVIYETRTVRWLEREPGASAAYLLQPDELRVRFLDWELLDYEETGASASLVARRPAMQ
jgi:SAM-dependent methyltransferase